MGHPRPQRPRVGTAPAGPAHQRRPRWSDGAILRVDPATGNALPNNPLIGNSDPNARRIIAYGLRNPSARPSWRVLGTDEIWVGDVSWNVGGDKPHSQPHRLDRGELRLAVLRGARQRPGYDDANLNICENLYGQANAVSAPYFAYNTARKSPRESCAYRRRSSISGLAFYKDGPTRTSTTMPSFSPTTRASASGRCRRAQTGCPTPGNSRPS